jgi:hypothetical protein
MFQRDDDVQTEVKRRLSEKDTCSYQQETEKLVSQYCHVYEWL